MADDIDIEEHDVFDNPVIKNIFPDLSIFKKEVFDESYEGYNPEEENYNVDKQCDSTTVEEMNNGFPSPALLVHKELLSSHSNNSDKEFSESDCEELSKVFISNRIILGSKPNNTGSSERKCERNIYSATVKLKNISTYLDCCKKYCQTCFILFPSREALKIHIQQFHFDQTPDKIKLYKVPENNHEDISEHLNETKPKCHICHKQFASKKSLNKHRRNIHFIFIRPSRKNKTKPKSVLKIRHTENDTSSNNDANSCFHCENKFPSMQCLIEHLYETLQTKKENKVLNNARENLHKLKYHKKDAISNGILPQKNVGKVIVQRKRFCASLKKYFYRCPFCFYCYNNEKCSSDHLLLKHKFVRKAPLKKVLFEPKCKFCLSEFKTVKHYNSHIYKVHRKMFTRKSGHSKKPLLAVNKYKDENTHESHLTAETETALKEVNDEESSPPVSTNIGFFKSALFRCVRCDIHFLNCHTATDHTNHMEILINWKCSLCTRIFKNIDEHMHRQQHLVSDDFTVYGISDSTIALFKCVKCDVHFDENSYVQHYQACGISPKKNVKCKPCGILLDYNIYKEHSNYHKNKLNERSDMVFIQSEVFQDNNEDDNILNKNYEQLRIRNVKTDNNKDDMTQDLKKKHFFTVFYCHTCKCFINDTKIIFHKKALCTDVTPKICKLCGLVITRTNITSHGRLHLKKKDLTLQDFKLCDLNRRRIISPPIPNFPHCSICGIYFANLMTKIRHECGVVDFVTCYECAKDYSKLAYKLHMGYHNYQLSIHKMISTKDSSPIMSKNNMVGTLEVDTEEMSNVGSKESFIIFTCKNCDISLDTYDLVVEHCQGHYNLVIKPLPSKICKTCNLKFSANCFESHKKIHVQKNNSDSVIFLKFDLFYFASDYKAWMKRILISLPQDLKQNIINKSIYKYENRIKMRIIQEGSAALVYKCDKCKCFIDPCSLYTHLGYQCVNLQKHLCKLCEMSFISISSKLQHEAVHLKSFKGLKSCKVILFNKEEDRALNEALQNSEIWFTLYKCRNCGGIISKESETSHLCYRKFLKECSYCSLLFYRKELKLHLSKHKQVDSFKGENMKVIVIGKKNESCNMKLDGSSVSLFKGKVCDYLLYKCKSCQVCLRDTDNIQIHDCTNSIPMEKCSQCGFYLEAKYLDDHYMQHETDCDFVAENITVIEFDNTALNNLDSCAESASNTDCEDEENNIVNMKNSFKKNNDKVDVLVKTAKLYKCSCGLHFMDKSVTAHLNVCHSKNRVSRQQCSKCGLAFSPNVLFTHLLSHHGNKNESYKFKIIEVSNKK